VSVQDFFVDLMMTEELSLPVPSENGAMEALQSGLTMFLAFAIFGMLPVIGFVVAGFIWPELDTSSMFAIACVVTGACLVALGAFKASFHDKQYLRSGVETVVLGGACAAVAFAVGRAVSGMTSEGGALESLISRQ
jgi:VIT1/CCC1 family predicted Fe2+/Mn2+ transporter